MGCWPANSVGAFFLALLVFDMVQGDYSDLPFHSLIGLVLTGLFWAICSFVGVSISGGILLVPATFLIVFLFAMWMAGRSFQGCCMDCPEKSQCKPKKWHLKPRTDSCAPPLPPEPEKCQPGLNTTPLV